MKLSGKSIDPFLRRPDENVVAVLFHGPDGGLVRERAAMVGRTVVDDLNDPFRVVDLTGADVKEQPARLVDAAAQLSLTGGRQLVRVRDATDGAADAFKGLLAAAPANGAFVVVEAGMLAKRSSLRNLFEKSKLAASIGCYADGARDLARLIDETLAGHGLRPSRDAKAFLVSHLGGDRLVSRGELEKLALYMGADGERGDGKPRVVELQDAVACIGDSGAMSVEALVFLACSGDIAGLDRAFERAMGEGVSPVPILRTLQRHLHRLQVALRRVADGDTPKRVVNSAVPPVIFIFEDQFLAQLRQWRPDALAAALDLATEAEIDCKSTGFPDRAGCHRALMRIAQAARGGRRAA